LGGLPRKERGSGEERRNAKGRKKKSEAPRWKSGKTSGFWWGYVREKGGIVSDGKGQQGHGTTTKDVRVIEGYKN